MNSKVFSVDNPFDVPRAEVEQRLGDPSFVLVDTLPAESYAEGHIPGARSLPLADIPIRARDWLPDHDADIVVYCGGFTCPIAQQAAELLREYGYTHVRHYRGGLADWIQGGGVLEKRFVPTPTGDDALAEPIRPEGIPVSRYHRWGSSVLGFIERQSASNLFLAWLSMIVLCGIAYWLSGLWADVGLKEHGRPLDLGLHGVMTALYFSFVTATSVGYGDVVPIGAIRIVAIAEAITGLLIFGAVVAKFVSRRQDELMGEIHRITFEDRLDRVQTTLHLVRSDIQAITALCDAGTVPLERVESRLESTTLVFVGELRAIHDLLYRPQWAPEEPVLQAILESLAASLRELDGLLACLPLNWSASPAFEHALATVSRLADEICGHCVPYAYAQSLTVSMDRVQQLARAITGRMSRQLT
ncbi:MAG TPA: rhodanese-like domain-containing protein [Methylococcaceae bacterium]|nr:rhodanese-like domain-containing protein [Methylococcaceae bacterium]